MESVKITLDTLAPGLNGSNGLMRMHYSMKRKWKDKIKLLILSNTREKISGPVLVLYERYTIRLMDWDNMCSTFKFIGDALVSAGVIEDDDPTTIISFEPRQHKVGKFKDQKTVVTITPLPV